jgi:hypothetical protein
MITISYLLATMSTLLAPTFAIADVGAIAGLTEWPAGCGFEGGKIYHLL